MNFRFDDEQMGIMFMSLLVRRNNILALLKMERMPDTFYPTYNRELSVVDGLLEKLFPGSVERIKANTAA